MKVFIEYNPYNVTTKIEVNEKPLKRDSRLYYQNQISEWINDLPQKLLEEYSTKKYEITFKGIQSDYEMVANVFDKVEENDDFTIKMEYKPIKELEDIKSLISNIICEIKNGPFEELKQIDFISMIEILENNSCTVVDAKEIINMIKVTIIEKRLLENTIEKINAFKEEKEDLKQIYIEKEQQYINKMAINDIKEKIIKKYPNIDIDKITECLTEKTRKRIFYIYENCQKDYPPEISDFNLAKRLCGSFDGFANNLLIEIKKEFEEEIQKNTEEALYSVINQYNELIKNLECKIEIKKSDIFIEHFVMINTENKFCSIPAINMAKGTQKKDDLCYQMTYLFMKNVTEQFNSNVCNVRKFENVELEKINSIINDKLEKIEIFNKELFNKKNNINKEEEIIQNFIDEYQKN
ncbi:MAG: hypothetical protein IJV15_06840 [Lachnospiraceae bacterium]|nr:hypothetical protein [Lachnospiraceae bacterium]